MLQVRNDDPCLIQYELCNSSDSVSVSFNPISYTVTEGEDEYAELILIRSGEDLSRETVVTVTTADGSATGER